MYNMLKHFKLLINKKIKLIIVEIKQLLGKYLYKNSFLLEAALKRTHHSFP